MEDEKQIVSMPLRKKGTHKVDSITEDVLNVNSSSLIVTDALPEHTVIGSSLTFNRPAHIINRKDEDFVTQVKEVPNYELKCSKHNKDNPTNTSGNLVIIGGADSHRMTLSQAIKTALMSGEKQEITIIDPECEYDNLLKELE